MRTRTILSVVLLTASLVACGGGAPAPTPNPGGGDPTPTPGAFDLSVSTARLPVLTGGSATLTVNVTRQSGFTGPVTVALQGLPAGASAAPVTVAADQTSATMTVSAAGAAAHSLPTTVKVHGEGDGRTVDRDVTVTVRGAAGVVDTSFGQGGKAVVDTSGKGADDYAYAMAVQPDGKIVVAGYAPINNTQDFSVIRLTRDGALDPSFGTGGRVTIDFDGKSDDARAVAVAPDGKIVVAGSVTVGAGSGDIDFGVARLNTDGTPDAGFGAGGKVSVAIGAEVDRAYAVLVQPDGKVVAGGYTNAGPVTGQDFALVRLTTNGTPDASFGTNGRAVAAVANGTAGDIIHALALQGDRIVAAGGPADFQVARFTSQGQLDTTFGSGGKLTGITGSSFGNGANAVVIDAQNRIVVAGNSAQNTAAVRLGENGALDTSFGTGGKTVVKVSQDNWDEATGVALQSDGKVVLGGWVYEGGGSSGNFTALRLTADGQPDATFGQGGVVITAVADAGKSDLAHAMVLQPDERVPATRILLAGQRSAGANDFAVTRLWE
ncbi:hypothetical protein [Deinococcus pimensis]|uniref:hypothetical protein n=1 Tax=Deinococcus pimensis TaxID=309888 RepID=UPI000484084B|nr:hypothetical protein [Deinococcus pimensis]